MNDSTDQTTPRGRPSKYKPQYAQEGYELCLLGFTNRQLSEHFGINLDTIKQWQKTHPEFYAALKQGKALADGRVALALFERAVGFEYEETTFEKITLEPNSEADIQADAFKKKVVVKRALPDTGAAMNWLKNRQKELWRDNLDLDFNKLTDEQLDKIISGLARKGGANPKNTSND
jgi:hypothetical protein